MADCQYQRQGHVGRQPFTVHNSNVSCVETLLDKKNTYHIKRYSKMKNVLPSIPTEPTHFRTTTNGRGGLLASTGSLSGHPSKQQPRSMLLDSVYLPNNY
ncbi:hypothetical protein J6590_069482 [Homalodisca vitripennis]|nr:hypothetical protein J6590_069482 [Homalodisca vitripennis]